MIARIRELVAAERAMAGQALLEVEAGIWAETSESDAAQDRSAAADAALPGWLRRPAEWFAWLRCRSVWRRVWALEEEREAVALAVHRYWCVVPDEGTHCDPDEVDFEKADEIMAILAIAEGSGL